jgi:hypothetical protein
MLIDVAKYPQLHALCWNRPDDAVLDGDEALALYERNWRFVQEEALTPEERRLLATLIATCGNGVFLPA